MKKIKPETKTRIVKVFDTITAMLLPALWVYFMYLISQYFVNVIFSWIGMDLQNNIVSAFHSTLIYIVFIIFVLFITPRVTIMETFNFDIETRRRGIKQIGNSNREELGLKGWPTWTDILFAIVGFVAQLLLGALFDMIFKLFPWYNAEEAQNLGFSGAYGPDRIAIFALLVIVAPIAEELIFRGWLYGKLRGKLSFGKKFEWLNLPVSIIITSFLFGLVHGQWNAAVNVFALSIVLCLMREVTGTIYSGMLVHMLKNGLAFYLLLSGGML